MSAAAEGSGANGTATSCKSRRRWGSMGVLLLYFNKIDLLFQRVSRKPTENAAQSLRGLGSKV
jgi:hypothetical protein